METGSLIWVSDGAEGWVLGTVASRNGQDVSVKLKRSGDVVSKKANECYSALGSEPGTLRSISDLTRLPALHEAALLQALQERYEKDDIYTSVGPILIAVNPFKRIPNLYNASNKWINQQKDLPPHVYGLADASFRSMLDHKGCNQSMLVSGESGAGKTETTKHAMHYLTEVSGGSGAEVSSRILSANPLLEAFGNAKTIRNDNSSRFGKLIEMKFADHGRHKLIGAGVTSYLLEKARVVHQCKGERNYHIFYELFAGWSKKSNFGLMRPQEHCYLTSSGEYRRADIDDAEQFQKTLEAMQTLGFSEQDCDEVFRIVTGVIFLGDIEFEARQGGEACAIANEDALRKTAEFLGIEPGRSTDKSLTNPERTLADVLCVRRITVQGVGDALGQGETYVKPLNCQFAREARDALAMAVYERLFAWIVWRVNYSMQWNANETGPESQLAKGAEKMRHQYRIGVLDIFGFEVFAENFFEQLCINYANEQLQRQFNEHVFELEQKMYEAEGVDWTFVEFPDNSATIHMIEAKPIGLLSLIDEECMYPNGSDKSLASKLYQNLAGKSDRFVAPHAQQRDYLFTVKHFAGDVTYTVGGFYRKNKNELRQDAVDLMCDSKHFLTRLLLPPDAQEAAGGADAATYFEKRAKQLEADVLARPGSAEAQAWTKKPLPIIEKSFSEAGHGRSKSSSGRRSQLQQTTVSSHFKSQLHSALSLIRASMPHYVRCLKPNDRNQPLALNRPRVLNQLRYSGVVEVIKVARAGYPTRFDVPDFVERYACLIKLKPEKGQTKSSSNAGLREARRILATNDAKLIKDCGESICISSGLERNIDFQVGKTKVFLRADAMTKLEMAKNNKLKGAVRLIQRTWRKWYSTHRSERAVKKIQRIFRGYNARRKVRQELKRRRAAADIIHSDVHFQRWLAQIRENLQVKIEIEAQAYSGETPRHSRVLWWYIVPLACMAGVPAFLRRLYYAHPNLLILLLLAFTGLVFGSVVILDAQHRGIMPRGSVYQRRKSSAHMAMLEKKRRKASAVLNSEKQVASPIVNRKASSSASASSIGGLASRKSVVGKRFGGLGSSSPAAPVKPVQIVVNADAVKRFAGLAMRRKEAMERAKRKAEDMLRTGELQSAMKRGSGHFNHMIQHAMQGDSTDVASDARSSASTAALSVEDDQSPRVTARKSSDISMERRQSTIDIGVVPPTSRSSSVSSASSNRGSTLGMSRGSTLGTSMVAVRRRSSATSDGKPVTRAEELLRRSSNPPPLPPNKPKIPQGGYQAPKAKGRSDSDLNEDEQHMLNKAILAMFLEEQAPERADMADDLLTEFKGREEVLFEKLTEEFPDTNALHESEQTDTPVWDRFVTRRKQRQSTKGFFGTAPQMLGIDDVRVVQERTDTGSRKNRFSVSAKKLSVVAETTGRNLLSKFTGQQQKEPSF